MKVSIPELLWHGNRTLEIAVPDDWDVEVCPMRGARRARLGEEEIAAAIRDPIGCPRIRKLAAGKRTAVVLFDDMTRPTPVHEIVPIVLRELIEADIGDDGISLVCALGTHGALSRIELRKKLGSQILERFRVYNHNCYENCVYVGTTSRGTRLAVNRGVMSADLKIAIGCVTAHPDVGFSGGGKAILPGVAHIDSITHLHLEVPKDAPGSIGLGAFDRNVMRLDIEEAARMAGLDLGIDVIVNDRGAISGVFAGDFIDAHERAVAAAKTHYSLDPAPANKQVIIANAFAKPNEIPIAVRVGSMGLERSGGTVVVIANAPEGQVVHYLLGRFGREYGGRQYSLKPIPDHVRLVVQAAHGDKTIADWFPNPEVVTHTRTWAETLGLLRSIHGPGSRVGIIPNATMAYYDR
jgi:nickel-dependent lactate racemase